MVVIFFIIQFAIGSDSNTPIAPKQITVRRVSYLFASLGAMTAVYYAFIHVVYDYKVSSNHGGGELREGATTTNTKGTLMVGSYSHYNEGFSSSVNVAIPISQQSMHD
jgi:disulfide bond formation protein DsbB